MDALQALTELTEISSQIEAACLFEVDGTGGASTLSGEDRSKAFVASARALLHDARSAHSGEAPLVQLEAATLQGGPAVVHKAEVDQLLLVMLPGSIGELNCLSSLSPHIRVPRRAC